MPYEPIANETHRANPFVRTYRQLRSFAEQVGNDLCRTMERWFMDDETPVGGSR